jgi:PPOX class probable F420-dependent enzyme
MHTLAQERYVSLTTFKRDGTPVSTPVWCVGDGERLLVWTAANTWKVRRIRREPHVRVAPSTAAGKPRGAPVDTTATILPESDRVQALLAAKYGLVYRLVRWFNALVRLVRRRPAAESVTLVIR